MLLKIQNYYGLAIKQNTGDLEGMKLAIKAIKHHTIEKSDETFEQQHRFCPKHKDTWCRFWADRNENTKEYSSSSRLPNVFFHELKNWGKMNY